MQSFITEKIPEIIELCRTHHVRRFSVFGSAVRDDFNPDTSDVDVRVEFDENSGISGFKSDYFELHEKLESLFDRRVDMLSAKTIKNRYLRREIEDTQVTVYAS